MFPCLMYPDTAFENVELFDPVYHVAPVDLFAGAEVRVEEEESKEGGFCGLWQSLWPTCCLHFTSPDPRLRGCTLPNKLK